MQNRLFTFSLIAAVFICSTSYAQTFSKPMEKEILRIEDQSRLIKGASVKVADELLIDTLLDNDWILGTEKSKAGTRTAWKIVDCRVLSVVNTTVVATLLYTLDKHKDGVIVRVSINLDSACAQSRDSNFQQDLYKKFWESGSVGKFYTGLRIEALKSE